MLSQCGSTIYNTLQPNIHTAASLAMSSLTLLLPPKCTLHLIRPPVNFNLTLVHVLVNPLYPLADTNVLPLALFKHLEH